MFLLPILSTALFAGSAQFPAGSWKGEIHVSGTSLPLVFRIRSINQVLEGKTKPACIVLVSGSGPQSRYGEIFGHKSFWVLADVLTKNGYAVLRYDDRGTAKSRGNYENATMDDFASDAYAAVEYLKTRNDIGRIGMAGHSEGGGIVSQVAAAYPKDIAFLVLLAGPGLRGDSLLLLQKKTADATWACLQTSSTKMRSLSGQRTVSRWKHLNGHMDFPLSKTISTMH